MNNNYQMPVSGELAALERFALSGEITVNSCGYSDCPPTWSWDTGEGGFPDYDLWFSLRGRGALRDPFGEYPAAAGSCLLLAPGLRYTGAQDAGNPLLVINVHFSFSPSAMRELHRHRRTVPHTLGNIPFFTDVLKRVLINHNGNNPTAAAQWLRSALVEFLSAHVENVAFNYGTWNRIVGEIRDTVHLRFASPPSLEELSRRYGYSADYIGRMFRLVANVSYSQYVANARSDQARLLLLTTQLPVGDIAEQLGYYDTCHFVKQFKKHTGKTPHSYRKGL
jgi:AraC-like DNA-binding protein